MERRKAPRPISRANVWWSSWPTAARDHETSCVSCHTALPYALARPALRDSLTRPRRPVPSGGDRRRHQARAALERSRAVLSDQTRGLPKPASRAAPRRSSNAVILATRDAHAGRPERRRARALDNMWALQFRTGDQTAAWAWLNFHNEPWEANDSPRFFGAALAAIAVGRAPGGYAAARESGSRQALRGYLTQGEERSRWSTARCCCGRRRHSRICSSAEQRSRRSSTLLRRQGDDGGWSPASLGSVEARRDSTPLERRATATRPASFRLRWSAPAFRPRTRTCRAGSGGSCAPGSRRRHVVRLVAQQAARSEDRLGKFMSDAATAYAVLALTAEQ